MLAYKGFNSDLTCSRGNGRFQYEIGKTYEEEQAKAASTGFHCTEDPLAVLHWYSSEGSRYCMVRAEGDINEDGSGIRISCTKMTIVKELTKQQLLLHACKYMMDYPERKPDQMVRRNEGTAVDGFAIVRGRNPRARGRRGTTLYLLKERKNTIIQVGVYEVDGKKIKENTYYDINGREVMTHEKRTA